MADRKRATRAVGAKSLKAAKWARIESLEWRTLLSGSPHSVVPAAAVAGVTASHGYAVSLFANNSMGTSQPDSIVVDGANVFVGYQDGVAKDGSDGMSSTVVQYSSTGAFVRSFSVPGHNDGLKVDPATHLLWSLQNEDANPNLVIIDPVAATQTPYTFAAPPANGGGYDDIAFVGGKVFFSESNPMGNPNTAPAIVQATLSGSTVVVTPVLMGNATATGAHRRSVTLNLQDPDSMTVDASGDLVLTSQADNELVVVKNPGATNQSAALLSLTDAKHKAVSVDDTLFAPKATGSILATDLAGAIYLITGPTTKSALVLSAAPDIGKIGALNVKTGRFTPVVTGLTSPHGLAFLTKPAAAKGYTVTPFAGNPLGASQPDSIVVDGANVFVGYQDGVAKDGSDGMSSTVVQYSSTGTFVRSFSVPGHNDGLKVDPATHLLWSLQNEDANPNLVIIDPVAATQTPYTFAAPPANGGGYDDIAFVGGKVFFSESNPMGNPNTAPAIVQATLSGSTVVVTPVLMGNATATGAHRRPVTLNLQDPDSMTVDASGDLVLTSQADNELVVVKNPGAADQSAALLSLTDAKHKAVSVDDTLFAPKATGSILATDLAGAIYLITGPTTKSALVLSAAPDIGKIGALNVKTGRFTPVVTGLTSPHGLAAM